jgi:hypothetical protein
VAPTLGGKNAKLATPKTVAPPVTYKVAYLKSSNSISVVAKPNVSAVKPVRDCSMDSETGKVRSDAEPKARTDCESTKSCHAKACDARLVSAKMAGIKAWTCSVDFLLAATVDCWGTVFPSSCSARENALH